MTQLTIVTDITDRTTKIIMQVTGAPDIEIRWGRTDTPISPTRIEITYQWNVISGPYHTSVMLSGRRYLKTGGLGAVVTERYISENERPKWICDLVEDNRPAGFIAAEFNN